MHAPPAVHATSTCTPPATVTRHFWYAVLPHTYDWGSHVASWANSFLVEKNPARCALLPTVVGKLQDCQQSHVTPPQWLPAEHRSRCGNPDLLAPRALLPVSTAAQLSATNKHTTQPQMTQPTTTTQKSQSEEKVSTAATAKLSQNHIA
jgi:hypothetical protein